ncbi:hypothetical protein KY289_009475 [Solanum tuberosum]|nr:hypothetical protein KY289_009475 [Solanum tuberosum]
MVDLSQAPVMGRFRGDNPLDWVMQTEKYFIFYDILSEHKLSWASFYLDGEALEWYRWLFQNKQLAGWDHFVDKLFIRFQSRKAPHNRFAFLRQFTTVDDSQARAATNSSWSTIANSPSPQSWTARSDYNKVNSAHQVFGEKLNKTTDIVVDVTNATMLVKSGSAEMLANQAKEEVFHSILDATTKEVDCPVPQHLNEPLVYLNNQAHKVFDEFSVASKDVILESHKVLTINTDTTEESDYFTDVGNEDKNEEEELFTIGNKIRQLVPAFVGIPQLWVDSTFSSFGYFAMFNMLHKLGIARCSEELSRMLSTCKYDQLTNGAFPFDPGSRLLTMSLRVTRNSVFCLASDNLDHNKFIMSTLWYSFIWAGKGQAQCPPGFLLSKSRELGKAEKIQGSLEAFAAQYLEQFPKILVNKDDVLDAISVVFGVVEMKFVWRTCIKKFLLLAKIAVAYSFVCNIFTKDLYSLSSNNDYGWSVTLQPYSHSSPGFVITLTFANHPFDPGIHDIPLCCGANENLFQNSSFIYSYFLVVTWRGEHICGLEWQHMGTDASEHFSSSLEFLLAPNHASVVEHIWMKLWLERTCLHS